MARLVRVALAGLGDIGMTQHLPALLRAQREGHVEIAGLVDPDPDRRAHAASVADAATASAGITSTTAGTPTHPDIDDVLADATIPAIVLATPPWITTNLTVRCAEAGRFVLAEKPLATSVAAARPVADLPSEVRGRVQVGLTYRHDPVLEQLRARIESGPLDGPKLVRAHIYDEPDDGDAEHVARIRRTLEHGPPVVHEGAHVFDWLAYLLGSGPDRVADAWSVRTDPSYATPNLVGGRLRYPGGTQALVEFGWMTARLPRCEISLLGRKGYALLDGFSFRLEVQSASGTEVVDDPADRMTRCFDRQLARFARLVDGRTGSAVPGVDEGLAALRTAEEISVRALGDESSGPSDLGS